MEKRIGGEDKMTDNKTYKCLWKIVLEENERGVGTSFIGRTRKDLICYDCDGYNVQCKKYATINDDNYLITDDNK